MVMVILKIACVLSAGCAGLSARQGSRLGARRWVPARRAASACVLIVFVVGGGRVLWFLGLMSTMSTRPFGATRALRRFARGWGLAGGGPTTLARARHTRCW